MRAGRVCRPEDYGWSSVHANLGFRFDSLVTPHACFLALGADPGSRRAAYSDWLRAGADEEQLWTIRSHLAQQRAYGDAGFQAMIERTLKRPPRSVRAAGRLGAETNLISYVPFFVFSVRYHSGAGHHNPSDPRLDRHG